MNNKLQAIRAAWAQPRDEELARELANEYVAAHPAEFARFEQMTRTDCVQSADAARASGTEEDVWRVETWVLHRYPPQHIHARLGN